MKEALEFVRFGFDFLRIVIELNLSMSPISRTFSSFIFPIEAGGRGREIAEWGPYGVNVFLVYTVRCVAECYHGDGNHGI